MAKTVKFNLICDKNPIRTIEDLQNNFSVEDILAYYDNRLLHRWLEVRGYDEELKKVSDITSTDKMNIIMELIKIFNVPVDEDEIEKSVYILQFLDERKELYKIYKEEEYKTQSVIDNYATGYVQLVDDIIQNPADAPKIKADIEEIVNNYGMLLGMNYRELFYTLKPISPLAILCLLMNEKSRTYYSPQSKEEVNTEIDEEDVPEIESTSIIDGLIIKKYKTNSATSSPNTTSTAKSVNSSEDVLNNDKISMFNAICSMSVNWDIVTQLGENIITFSGDTDGYWKDLEPKGKKYMIISMDAGDYVRSAGVTGGDKSYVDVTNKFIILDGIDYKSKSPKNTLMYMEV